MDKKLAKEFLKQIERAYRRGFQQGYTIANLENPPTEDQIYDYRFKISLTNDYYAPESQRKYIPIPVCGSILKRLEAETCLTPEGRSLTDYFKEILR